VTSITPVNIALSAVFAYNTTTMAGSYERILIVKPSALGDIVQALPALSALHDSFPQARISWLVCPEFAPLLEGHPYLAELIHFDRKLLAQAWRNQNGRRALRSLIRDLRDCHFDASFDFQGLLRSSLAGWLSRIPHRFGPANSREGASLFYTQRVAPDARSMHVVDHYLAMVSAAGGERPAQPRFVFPPFAEAQAQVRQWQQQEDIQPGRYAVLIAGSAHDDKCWPVERFSMLADRIYRNYHIPVLLAGTENEHATAERICSLARCPLMNLAGATDLPELVSLLRDAALVVSNDTGPGHIAAGLDIPLVILFSWSNPARIYPYGRTECMVAVEPFERGGNIRSKETRHNVVNLSLDQVWERVQMQMERVRRDEKRAVRDD
jgi:lipopolysaccharide heptosyltransferase I